MSFFKPAEIKDVEVVDPPADGISQVSFSPVADLLAVSSWSNEVRVYEVAAGGATQGRAMYRHEGPVLCIDWSKVRFLPPPFSLFSSTLSPLCPQDGTKIVSGYASFASCSSIGSHLALDSSSLPSPFLHFCSGADNAARMFDAASGQTIQIGAHEAPVRCIQWIDVGGGIVCTGSWDKVRSSLLLLLRILTSLFVDASLLGSPLGSSHCSSCTCHLPPVIFLAKSLLFPATSRALLQFVHLMTPRPQVY